MKTEENHENRQAGWPYSGSRCDCLQNSKAQQKLKKIWKRIFYIEKPKD